MKTIEVVIPRVDGEYPIIISDSFLDVGQFITGASKVVVITDTTVEEKWIEALRSTIEIDSVITLQPGETSKNLASVEIIWKELQKIDADRSSIVLNLGGGVICDIGAFAASTFKRGVPFVQLPTTLLAQADAAIGGKTGFDYDDLKNQIGTFAQPVAVISNVSTLSTLDEKVYAEGWAEIIKHAMIADPDLFAQLKTEKIAKTDTEELVKILTISSQIKASVVSSDEQENGFRKMLNFGHTIGHAIESAALNTDAPLLHGEAVSLGMLAELEVFNKQTLAEELKIVLESFGLPVRLAKLPSETAKLIDLMRGDKKNNNGTISFSVPSKVGECEIDQTTQETQITKALERITNV